jgi:hypothetical protein
MSTAKQTEANRKNAKNSTGPKTPTGKAITAQNATKHGLTAQNAVIKGEDPADFDLHRDEMLEYYNPQGPVETALTHRIITLSWQIKRSPNLHTAVINYQIDKVQGFESEDTDPELILGRAIVRLFVNPGILDRLMLYERRIENSLHKSMNALQNLKKAKKNNPDQIEKTNPINSNARQACLNLYNPGVPPQGPQRDPVRQVEKTNPIPTLAERSEVPIHRDHCAEQSDKAIPTPTTPNPTETEKTNPISTPQTPHKTPYDPTKWLRPAPLSPAYTPPKAIVRRI